MDWERLIKKIEDKRSWTPIGFEDYGLGKIDK